MINKLIEIIKLSIIRQKWKRRKVNIKSGCKVSLSSTFEGYNSLGKNTFFSGNIGYASYIGEDCHMVAEIGKYTCIASRVITVRGAHPSKTWVSVHPAFYSEMKQCGMTYVDKEKFNENKPPVKIGNDVWIGDSALLLDGIKIGDGAIIAAGAVVTKDVEPYTIVGGVPAKEIRKRFNEEQVEFLLKTKWWEKDPDWIKNNANHFCNIEEFVKIKD